MHVGLITLAGESLIRHGPRMLVNEEQMAYLLPLGVSVVSVESNAELLG